MPIEPNNQLMEEIKNDQLSVTVSAHGAELQSIRNSSGREYLWQGNPQYWGRRSPILFPFVGSCWRGVYHLDGKEYAMSRHGFARDSNFKLIAQGPERVTYALESSEETMRQYPFRFFLSVSYRLNGNSLHVIWHVHNDDVRDMYFAIGGHPAFNLPAGRCEGKLKFDNEDDLLERAYCTAEGGCMPRRTAPVETRGGIMELDDATFADDALIIDRSQVHGVTILDGQEEPYLTVRFKAPAMGLWSPAGKQAPFVCIEPWYGVTDREGFDGELRDRYLMNKLLPGASFMSEYTITVH